MAVTAKDVLTGSDVKVWLDGDEVGTWTTLEATVTINYEDVQIGFDVDRKAVSWQGDGNLNQQATNSFTSKLFDKIKANPDVRFVIEGELTKRSTGETEMHTINGVSFDAIPIATWNKGELVNKEMAFRFTPSSLITTDMID